MRLVVVVELVLRKNATAAVSDQKPSGPWTSARKQLGLTITRKMDDVTLF
jgi:hypothetical protein